MSASLPDYSSACGLDIGSNTISFCELEKTDDGLRVINDASLPVRLSEGLVDGGDLKAAAVARGLMALRELDDRYGIAAKPVRAVGTAVLRMTRNPDLFTEPARRILGRDVEIITGEQEALLVSSGAVLGLDKAGPWAIVDVGGQSIELSWSGSGSRRVVSLPTGVVGLTQRFLKADPPLPLEIETLERHIGEQIAAAVPHDTGGDLLAVAGTATSLGALELRLDRWEPGRLHGFEMRRHRIAHWRDQMLAVTTAERTARFGIQPRRADVFPAGIAALGRLMDHLGRDRVTISVQGLRVGAALSLLKGE